MTTAAVVLAAGAGARFAGPGTKLRAAFGTSTVLGTVLGAVIDAAGGATLDEVVVITGAIDVDDLLPARVTVVTNDAWRGGIATSLAVAIAHADAAGHDAVVVGLGDQPLVPSRAWSLVAASDASIAVATYGGRRRNPVRLARSVWPDLPTTGDEGARTVMRLRPGLVAEIPCPGEPADIDTTEDLARWS